MKGVVGNGAASLVGLQRGGGAVGRRRGAGARRTCLSRTRLKSLPYMLAHEKKKKKELTVQSDEGLLGVEGERKERHKARILRASKRLSTSHAELGPRDLSAPALIRVGIPYSRYAFYGLGGVASALANAVGPFAIRWILQVGPPLTCISRPWRCIITQTDEKSC